MIQSLGINGGILYIYPPAKKVLIWGKLGAVILFEE